MAGRRLVSAALVVLGCAAGVNGALAAAAPALWRAGAIVGATRAGWVLLVASPAPALCRSVAVAGPTRAGQVLMAVSPRKPAPIDVQVLRLQFAAIRELPRSGPGFARDSTEETDDGDDKPEPSFRRLFTHETWRRYTGGPTIVRWYRAMRLWRFSSVLHAVAPCSIALGLWSVLICQLLPASIARRATAMQLPLSLQGAAIGLLLVFRTNSGYRRLEEARAPCASNTIFYFRTTPYTPVMHKKCTATLLA